MVPTKEQKDEVWEALRATQDALNNAADALKLMDEKVQQFALEQRDKQEQGYLKHLDILLSHFKGLMETLNGSKGSTGESTQKDLDLMMKFCDEFKEKAAQVKRVLLKVDNKAEIEKANKLIGKYVGGIEQTLKHLG